MKKEKYLNELKTLRQRLTKAYAFKDCAPYIIFKPEILKKAVDLLYMEESISKDLIKFYNEVNLRKGIPIEFVQKMIHAISMKECE